MPSDLTEPSAPRHGRPLRSKNRLPLERKEKKGIDRSDIVLPDVASLPASGWRLWSPSGRIRGQGSVEYLFVVVFLVGFIVAVLVPSLQTAEISYALAGARTEAVAYEAGHPDLRLTTLGYSVAGNGVGLNLTVYNRSSDARVPAPQGLKDAVLSGIHALAPNYASNASCARTSNYDYCVVS